MSADSKAGQDLATQTAGALSEAREGLPPTGKSLPIALIRAREKVMGPIRDMLSTSDITEQQWRVLRVLHEYGPQDATSLAERAALHLPSQTRIVQTLSQKGYVTRDVDVIDRRRQTVAITMPGKLVLDSKKDEAARIAKDLEGRFGVQKLATLLSLLEELDQI
ncbi:MarR family transcriptional regulator [Roseibium algae]|uniref:MarR family transcriptional regulator n=1 Tax=Roseibium algae TaxID=3123038 RepID=A0ABU8TP72_9HYPH